MNRRGFLSAILATACAPAIVRAESLMRCSGIVVPTLGDVAAINGMHLTAAMVTREALRILHENLSFAQEINAEWESQFIEPLNAVLRIRRPQPYIIGA